MNYLLTAIMTKTSGSALSSDVAGRIYLDRAPEGAEFPYVVFFIVSDVPDWTFTDNMKDIMIQFSLFSASSGAAEITDMYEDLKTLFDDCSLSITGDTLLYMYRSNLVTMVEDVTTPSGTAMVRHWAVEYELMIQD